MVVEGNTFMSRTLNSLKNVKYAIYGQTFGIIINFISRTIFVRILSVEYLGINGLFSNILSILSLAELGIGPAIIYSMYKPLAEKDEVKLKALMNLYKKAYIVIGIIIGIAGTLLTPFLDFFINDIPNIPHIKLIYILYVSNSAISYFFSYKRNIIIADQKKYIDTLYHYTFYFLRNILQIFILLFTKNYILYLVIQLLSILLENVSISKKTDELYPFLKNNKESLELVEKKTIFKNVKALMLHKIGSVLVLSTDNILISKFIGLIEVGLYSNYLIIIQTLTTLFGVIFNSITSSVGNLAVTEGQRKNERIFMCIDLMCFWLFAFASICLIVLFNPFIQLWLGEQYLFSFPIVLLIVINFYLSGRRQSILTFRAALGLYWYDRYKPLFEAGVNLIVSIILVKQIGIKGIFIGTIVSTLTTCFWIEPYVLYKHGFKSPVKSYFIKYFIYIFLMIVAGVITYIVASVFNGTGFIVFCVKLIICIIIPNIIFVICFWRTEEFEYFKNIFKSYFNTSRYK